MHLNALAHSYHVNKNVPLLFIIVGVVALIYLKTKVTFTGNYLTV